MALYKKSRTYRAFDNEIGCFLTENYEFSYEISEEHNKKIKKSKNTFGKSYTIFSIIGTLLLCGVGILLSIITKIPEFLTTIACIPLFPIIEYCRQDALYNKYVRPLENMFETMYNKICVEERVKAKAWLRQHQDEPLTAHIQQVLDELNRG